MEKPTYADGFQFRREDIMRLVLYYNSVYSVGRSNYLRHDFADLECRLYVTGKYDFHNTYGIGLLDYNLFQYWHYDGDGGQYLSYWTTLQNAGEWLVSHEEDILSVFDQCEQYAVTFSSGAYDFISPHRLLTHDDWKSPWHYIDYKPKAKKYQKKP